jgi:hypothetical protein
MQNILNLLNCRFGLLTFLGKEVAKIRIACKDGDAYIAGIYWYNKGLTGNPEIE